MKIICLSSLFSLLVLATTAQTAITVGANVSNYRYEANGSKLDRDIKFGWNAGLMKTVKLPGKIFIQPSLLYTSKGAVNTNTPTGYHTFTNQINYVQLTLPIGFSWFKIPKISFYSGGGLYGAYAVSAKSKQEKLNGDKEDVKFNIGSDATDDFKAKDGGISLITGAKLGGFGFHFQYDYGVLNINPRSSNPNIKNRNFSANLFINL